MQSTETGDQATPANVTRADIDALVTELRDFGQAVTVGWLSADRYARAANALAAERDRADRAEVELDAVTSLDVDHFMDIWDSLPRVSYTTRVAMAQAAVELIKQATA